MKAEMMLVAAGLEMRGKVKRNKSEEKKSSYKKQRKRKTIRKMKGYELQRCEIMCCRGQGGVLLLSCSKWDGKRDQVQTGRRKGGQVRAKQKNSGG